MPTPLSRTITATLLLSLGAISLPATADDKAPRWTLDDVLNSDTRPFAIGHRGYGVNLGSNPDKPIENSVASVRRAFREGAQAVEIDVVLSRDGVAVGLHDDFLADLSCVNQYSLAELRQQAGKVATLRQLLQTARTFSVQRNGERPGGQVVIEIKAPSPLCDPEDTSVLALVAATLDEIEHTKMDDQVMITTFSPEILALVKQAAPALPRALSLSVLQLLSPAQLSAATGAPVTPIDKQPQFGLQWVEIGHVFRLPLYGSVHQFPATAVLLDARAATLDRAVLFELENLAAGSGQLFVHLLGQLGIDSLVYTVNAAPQWLALSALGVAGFYTDNLPMGLALEGQ